MDGISYRNFDLLIQRAGTGYRAQVVDSPAGQATLDFSLPFSELELENLLLRIGQTRGRVRSGGSPEMEATRAFGSRLFETIFTGDIRDCFRRSLDATDHPGSGLRIRLSLSDAPDLADLPWEYLYDSAHSRFLALSAETPLVRYLHFPERIDPLAVKPPLKILVMISSPTDHPRLDVDQEWERLRVALADLVNQGLVTLDRLDDATLENLDRRLRQGAYHVLHFIGHGGFDRNAQDGALILEDDQERGVSISGRKLGMLLHDHRRSLRLAVLNACEGARSGRSDPFVGTAQSIVRQGIPAVIAMQFEITDEAAITLTQAFYTALAEGLPVDTAVANARRVIFSRGNEIEWGTPVLYLRAPDGRIFDVEMDGHKPLPVDWFRTLQTSLQALLSVVSHFSVVLWSFTKERTRHIRFKKPDFTSLSGVRLVSLLLGLILVAGLVTVLSKVVRGPSPQVHKVGEMEIALSEAIRTYNYVSKDISTVQTLIDGGADVNVRDKEGKTFLMLAASENGFAPVVKALLAAGAEVNAQDNQGETAIIKAIRTYNYVIA
ncbi:MAG: CHAT domain-containing protein [Deltaproteobacteria bacterium]|nr:CHAT domain-containing protein [Deltaproteobacteria bacterium]